jgi:hypothetical protein
MAWPISCSAENPARAAERRLPQHLDRGLRRGSLFAHDAQDQRGLPLAFDPLEADRALEIALPDGERPLHGGHVVGGRLGPELVADLLVDLRGHDRHAERKLALRPVAEDQQLLASEGFDSEPLSDALRQRSRGASLRHRDPVRHEGEVVGLEEVGEALPEPPVVVAIVTVGRRCLRFPRAPGPRGHCEEQGGKSGPSREDPQPPLRPLWRDARRTSRSCSRRRIASRLS